MQTIKSLHEFLMAMPGTKLTYPFGEDVAVYKVFVGEEEKMYALVPENKTPLSISLKCDPTLAKVLREKYESIMEGYHLNKKHWNTMLLTDQLSDEEVGDLIIHSYNLVIGLDSALPKFDK